MALSPEQSTLLVLQYDMEEAVFYCIKSSLHQKGAVDGARGSIALKIAEKLDGRTDSRRCHSYESLYFSACQKGISSTTTLDLLDL